MGYEIETFPVGAFQCNCSLVMDPASKTAFVVDPGDEASLILDRVDHYGLTVSALWHTHAHIDHVGATKFLFEECRRRNREAGVADPVVYLHEGDRWLYENVAIQAAMLRLHPFDVTSEWTRICDQQTYEGFPGLRALHTPGHTPGSCCLDIKSPATLEVPRSYRIGGEQAAKRVVITGDTLFRRSIGRTDLWGGDGSLILKSIRAKLLGLPEDALVVPGHGPLTTIGGERAKNPFLGGSA
jgi:glyoxylase-like metal-dependent hydrolase (beta-lactamase superfamily II)